MQLFIPQNLKAKFSSNCTIAFTSPSSHLLVLAGAHPRRIAVDVAVPYKTKKMNEFVILCRPQYVNTNWFRRRPNTSMAQDSSHPGHALPSPAGLQRVTDSRRPRAAGSVARSVISLCTAEASADASAFLFVCLDNRLY